MPTAVMIESTEKTRSMTRDLQDRRGHRVGDGRRPTLLLLAFDVVMDLARALDQQEQAAGDEDEVAPGEVVAADG